MFTKGTLDYTPVLRTRYGADPVHVKEAAALLLHPPGREIEVPALRLGVEDRQQGGAVQPAARAHRRGLLVDRREAGEQLFHRLLAADLKAGLGKSAAAAD